MLSNVYVKFMNLFRSDADVSFISRTDSQKCHTARERYVVEDAPSAPPTRFPSLGSGVSTRTLSEHEGHLAIVMPFFRSSTVISNMSPHGHW